MMKILMMIPVVGIAKVTVMIKKQRNHQTKRRRNLIKPLETASKLRGKTKKPAEIVESQLKRKRKKKRDKKSKKMKKSVKLQER